MKLSATITTFLLTNLLLLPSCVKYEWSEFESIEFECHDISLSPSDNGFLWQGNIPSSSSSFYIVPDKKHKDVAFVSAIYVDSIQQSKPSDFSGEPPYLEAIPIMSGEWGAITYNHDTSPHAIVFQINENDADKPRVIKVIIGSGYKYSNVLLTQAPHSEQAPQTPAACKPIAANHAVANRSVAAKKPR